MSLIRHVSRIALGLLTGLALLGSACSKKAASAAPNAAAAASGLPGAAEVMAAVEKKDYEAALAGLTKIREQATEEQQSQVTVFTLSVKDKLMELSATDPKAAEALAALRMASVGR